MKARFAGVAWIVQFGQIAGPLTLEPGIEHIAFLGCLKMKASVSSIRIVRASESVLVLAAVIALAACQTDGISPSATDAPQAQTASARPATDAKPETPLMQTAKPAEPAGNPEPMTRARAARECWMRTEKANPHQDLDKRADVVNKCIDDKLKAASFTPPKT